MASGTRLATAAHVGEPQGERGALRRRARQRQPLEQHRLDGVEHAGPLVQPLERAERDVVGAELVGEPAIGGDRARVVALPLGERRHGDDDRAAARRCRGSLRACACRRRAARATPAATRRCAPAPRAPRPAAARARPAAPGGERAVDVAERRLLLPRHRRQERHAIDVGCAPRRRARSSVTSSAQLDVRAGQLIELRAHGAVERIETERLQLPAERAGRVAQLAPVQLRQPEPPRLLRRRVALRSSSCSASTPASFLCSPASS